MTNCNNRPDCPCPFCTARRKRHEEGRSESEQQNQLAEDFLNAYAATVGK